MASVQIQPQTAKHGKSETTILLIAAFKLVKALLLIAVGLGALNLLHRDAGQAVGHWIDMIRVDPDNRFVHAALERVANVSEKQLKALSIGTFIYAALLLTEGTGLLLRKRWAEYFTLITTALLIPLEIYELAEHFTATKVGVLIINIAIVVYLVMRIKRARAEASQ